MKLTRKIALLFVGGLGSALTVKAAIDARREIALYEELARSASPPGSFVITLAVEHAIGVLGVFVVASVPCVILLWRFRRGEITRNAAADIQVVTEATRRMAELEERHLAERTVTVGKLASMAHELGTPLAVVQARAQMLAAGDVDDAELGKEAEAILQQTRRMTQIVQDVLELARQKTTTRVAVDLGALARQTISMLQPLTSKRDVRLKLVEETAGAAALGEPSRLLQILTNLTLNAQQSMPMGGTVSLRVGMRRAVAPTGRGAGAADYCSVEVRDEGVGITKSDLPRIFDPFFTTKKQGEGTGLGLSVSYRIAAEHDGWIDAESRPGEGSRFTLYLPMASSPQPLP